MSNLTMAMPGLHINSRPVAKFGRGTVVQTKTGVQFRVGFRRWSKDIGYMYDVFSLTDLNEENKPAILSEYDLEAVNG